MGLQLELAGKFLVILAAEAILLLFSRALLSFSRNKNVGLEKMEFLLRKDALLE